MAEPPPSGEGGGQEAEKEQPDNIGEKKVPKKEQTPFESLERVRRTG